MQLQLKSLKIFLSIIVVGIIMAMTIVLVIVSYNVAYNAVDKAYLNQLHNFSRDIDGQVARFYDQQMANAEFFANNRVVIEAVESGNYERVTALFASFQQKHKIYANILILSPESNPRILAALSGVGARVGNTGYDDCITHNLNGAAYSSEPRMSPVTHMPSCLFSAPIKRGDTVIGIMGLLVNIGEYSSQVVNQIKVGKTGFPYICTLDGIAFAHPKKELILKLDVKKYEWGRKILKASSGDVIRYSFQGSDKIMVPARNEKYRFISGVTIGTQDIAEEARTLAIIMIALALVAVAGAGAGIYFIITKRLSPLEECKNMVQNMAGGDLTVRYAGTYNDDEIGDMVKALNSAIEQFEKTISGIIFSAQNVAQAVEQIAGGNQNLSQRTSEQASSLEEIASTIEEATAAINQNADNAARARDLTELGAGKSVEGNRVATEAVTSITEMNESSKKVADIIAVINDIAFQTNLLALNAAVEAARAGEQGRGFAVVAGEVRNLAQRAGNAAKEIEGLIKDTVNKVEKSTGLVNRTGVSLAEIAESARMSAQIINEIAAAGVEQRQGINQINNAVAEMDTMTQQNASLVEETASASEEMANQAQELLDMVGQFKISGSMKADIARGQRRGVRLKSLNGAGKMDGREKTASGAAAGKASERKNGEYIKNVLKKEGFEEF